MDWCNIYQFLYLVFDFQNGPSKEAGLPKHLSGQLRLCNTLFYLHTINEFSLVPQLGFAGEVYEQNFQLGQRVRNTEGDIFFGKVGIELGKNNWSFGVQAMLPIVQNLNAGNVEANYRWSLNMNYSL